MISLTSCFFFFIDYDIIAAELCYEIFAKFYFFCLFAFTNYYWEGVNTCN